MRFARTALLICLATLMLSEQARAQGTSTLCKFSAGPQKGQTKDYAPMAGVPVGTSCFDADGSTGVVVSAGGPLLGPGKDASGATKSTLCRFSSGIRKGETQDYAPMPAVVVGTPCQDGKGSVGSVVASP